MRVLDAVAVLALLWVAAWSGPLAGAGDSYDSGYVQNSCATAYNLFPYDANGRPLTGVRLYDQDGQPFDVSGVSCGQPGYGPFVDSGAQPGVYPYPTTTPADQAFPTGPPTSLAPLPGATLSPTTTPGVTGPLSPRGTP